MAQSCKELRSWLSHGRQCLHTADRLLGDFRVETNNLRNWETSEDRQSCGCLTVTKRYVGPPAPNLEQYGASPQQLQQTILHCDGHLHAAKEAQFADEYKDYWLAVPFLVACCRPSGPL